MVTLQYIGKSADDLRFFILSDGRHAGGITVHSVQGNAFSYGIAVSPAMRRRGIAKAALPLLFARMRRRGFTRAVVQIEETNAASLALHAALGFIAQGEQENRPVLTLSRDLGPQVAQKPETALANSP